MEFQSLHVIRALSFLPAGHTEKPDHLAMKLFGFLARTVRICEVIVRVP